MSDYRKLYLKYKQKYILEKAKISTNVQDGGVGFETVHIANKNQNLKHLNEMPIDCKKGALSQFKLNTTSNGDLYYNYSCENNANIEKAPAIDNYSARIEIKPDYLVNNLNNYRVDCPENSAISALSAVAKNDLSDKTHYRFGYNTKCKNVDLKNIQKKTTTYSDVSNGSINSLDKHDLKCDNGQLINSFRVENNPANSKEYRYIYKCGTPGGDNVPVVNVPIIAAPVSSPKGLSCADISKHFQNDANIKKSIFDNLVKDLEKYDCIIGKQAIPTQYLVVIFAGDYEYLNSGFPKPFFSNLDFLFFMDKTNKWYTQDDKLDTIVDMIKKTVESNKYKNIILIGQSMGGYAALYASIYINNAICFAFSPQTFNLKDNIKLINVNHKFPDVPILDLAEELECDDTNSKRYVVIGSSECSNEKEGIGNLSWFDHMYANHIMSSKNVKVIMVNQKIHKSYRNLEYGAFINNVVANIGVLQNDQDKAIQSIGNILVYK